MKRLIALMVILPFLLSAQQAVPDRLTVFVDCSNTWCDMTFIRSEITAVNFSLDRLAADVHVLLTSIPMGGGGQQYQVIFYHQKNFSKAIDTLRYSMSPVATDFEKRDQLVKYLKVGLASSVAKTKAIDEMTITMKSDQPAEQSNKLQTDKWNYWVYRINIDGSFDADANYKSGRLSGELSASRTTDKSITRFSSYIGKNRSLYKYDGGKTLVDNHFWGFDHSFIKTLGSRSGAGYEVVYNQSTFSNNQGKLFVRAAFEYNFFPYSEVNNKLFTLSYGPYAQHNNYYDSTIFNKTDEMLFGHMVVASLSLNQKWGTVGIGVAYRNFLHDWQFYNVGANINTDVRITGGLSFYANFFGSIVHDQLYLPRGGASTEEVLTRRRQLASSYNLFVSFGLTFRFGSILNNFVNPRFSGPGNWVF